MKRSVAYLFVALASTSAANAMDLVGVYQDALKNDPALRQADARMPAVIFTTSHRDVFQHVRPFGDDLDPIFAGKLGRIDPAQLIPRCVMIGANEEMFVGRFNGENRGDAFNERLKLQARRNKICKQFKKKRR